MTSSLETGTIVQSRYVLEDLLGEGGMGTVWSARHLVTEKRVALKFLKATSPELHRRLVREARVAAAVRHPNLVEVHDVLELPDGRPLLVMDLLEGEPLASLMERKGALGAAEVGALLVPVVSAVAAAHAAGIIHRDLKPDNIFLLSGKDAGVVKVLDFGIAKLTREIGSIRHTAAELTQTGSVLGTPTYMAPEQVFGERDIDHRADIWSLGIILYECLAGVCPTDGENVGQIFKTISQRSFAPLLTAKPSVPPDLAALVERMLATLTRERPTLAEVVAVLAFHAGLPAPVLPAPLKVVESDSPPASIPHIATQDTISAVTADPHASPRRVRSYVLAGAIVAASAAVVGIGWAFATEPEVPPAVAPAAQGAGSAQSAVASAPVVTPSPSAAPEALSAQASAAAPVASLASSAPMRSPPRASVSPTASPRTVSAAPSSTSLPGGVHEGSPY